MADLQSVKQQINIDGISINGQVESVDVGPLLESMNRKVQDDIAKKVFSDPSLTSTGNCTFEVTTDSLAETLKKVGMELDKMPRPTFDVLVVLIDHWLTLRTRFEDELDQEMLNYRFASIPVVVGRDGREVKRLAQYYFDKGQRIGILTDQAVKIYRPPPDSRSGSAVYGLPPTV